MVPAESMLIQFRVENHRSIRDEHALSLVAAAPSPDDRHLIRTPALAEPLLPATAIYGANASGKTNVLHALRFMREAVMLSHRLWEPDAGVPAEPFALSKRRRDPSLYEVDLVTRGVRWRYGFVCSPAAIEEEWLFVWPNRKKQVWFSREGEKYRFGRNLSGDNDAIRKLTRSNSLFLSTAAQNNHPRLIPLFAWFSELQLNLRQSRHLRMPLPWFNGLSPTQLSLFGDESGDEEREPILKLLRSADTGIVDVKIEHVELEISGRSRSFPRVFFKHKSADGSGPDAWLPLEVESSGTVALVALAPLLTRALGTGGLLCIDELESSLHPMLAISLLKLFQEKNPRGAQLLFTTHDTNLLGRIPGEPSLERDQVWFTEKDDEGATQLYPLTDFHPRKQENLERGYLQGRYGAVPFLGSFPEPPPETP